MLIALSPVAKVPSVIIREPFTKTGVARVSVYGGVVVGSWWVGNIECVVENKVVECCVIGG